MDSLFGCVFVCVFVRERERERERERYAENEFEILGQSFVCFGHNPIP